MTTVPAPSSDFIARIGTIDVLGSPPDAPEVLVGVGPDLQFVHEQIQEFQVSRPRSVVHISTRIATRFYSLAQQWKQDTLHCSSVRNMAMHPAYQSIIGMGANAIPFILADLREEPSHWFWALRAITGENPVPTEAQGEIEQMRAHWLEWGNRFGFEA